MRTHKYTVIILQKTKRRRKIEVIALKGIPVDSISVYLSSWRLKPEPCTY
jgi:hypothetical protein